MKLSLKAPHDSHVLKLTIEPITTNVNNQDQKKLQEAMNAKKHFHGQTSQLSL